MGTGYLKVGLSSDDGKARFTNSLKNNTRYQFTASLESAIVRVSNLDREGFNVNKAELQGISRYS